MELHQLKQKLLIVQKQLQLQYAKNVQLEREKSAMFDLLGQFEQRLDNTFANNSLGYLDLSQQFEQLTALKSKVSVGSSTTLGINPILVIPFAHSVTPKANPNESLDISTDRNKPDSIEHADETTVNSLDDTLNTTFVFDDEDESMDETLPLDAQKKPLHDSSNQTKSVQPIKGKIKQSTKRQTSRPPVVKTKAKNKEDQMTAKNVQAAEAAKKNDPISVLSRGRVVKRVNYNESPTTRKWRRSK